MSTEQQGTARKTEHQLHPNPARILVVDDDKFSTKLLEAHVLQLGHEILLAKDGSEGLTLLRRQSDNIDVVLMDREMPVMDGLTAVRRITSDPKLRHIPVIMITGSTSAKSMQEGLEAGVFYYLTKPVDEQMLKSVLAAALRKSRQSSVLAEELGKHRTSFHLLQSCKFVFQTLAEAESLAAFMANCFPHPKRVLTGLGELLINAVEHGNLGIGYQGKSKLLEQGSWAEEVNRLQQSAEHRHKKASVTIARKENGIYVVVQDEGEGFNWKKYLTIDPTRAGDTHGRGIAQAKALSFDSLMYNETGNQAVAFVGYEQQLQW